MSLRPTERAGKVRWTWPIGTFFGVPTRVHISMALLAAYAVFEGMTGFANPWLGAALSLAGLVIVFASVLLHEFGHVLMARRFGIHTRSVTLSPLGGIAQLERLPERPQEELRVALAGPAVNVALAVAAVGISLSLGAVGLAPGPAGVLLDLTLWANVTLAVFNMVPAFPMDGGRVLRAAIEFRRGRLRATEVTASIGAWVALALGVWSLATGRFLTAVIALFVWRMGQVELAHVRARLGGGVHGVPQDMWGDPMAQLRDRFRRGSSRARGRGARPRVVDVPLIEQRPGPGSE